MKIYAMIILSILLCTCVYQDVEVCETSQEQDSVNETFGSENVEYTRNFDVDELLTVPLPIEEEVQSLTKAMNALFLRVGGSAEVARERNIDRFARFLVYEVEDRYQRGEWLPLGREKAPAFLAAIALHESSWRWLDSNFKGDRGERCAFQVSYNAMHNMNVSPHLVATDPSVCLDVALNVFHTCMKRCGDTPAEDWMACYAQSGQCTDAGITWVVRKRFETTRQILALQL